MIRSMSIGVFGLLSLICCLATTSALAQNYPCTAAGSCNFWVAAQGPGDPSSYFNKGAKKAQISAIKVGDTLTANIEEINVRSETPHAGWNPKDILFPITRGQVVQVLELKNILGGGGQLWLRIRRPDVVSAPPPVPPTQSQQPANPPATLTGSCLNLPTGDGQSAVPVIEPPVASIPPSPADLARLLQGRDIFCDQYGLIVHKNPDGTFNGGDTAAREGWYWLGVWIRQKTPGLERWEPKRKLTFDRVLRLLEPDGNGVFYRHPKQAPYNKGFDKDWGTSRDQLVPLVAAMGVWGNHDAEIRRLWDALPEDIQGKHAFNGNWRNALGQDGPNCHELKNGSCSPTKPCPAETDTTQCPADADQTSCSAVTDTTDCHRERCILNRPGWPIGDGGCAQSVGYNDPACELAKAAELDPGFRTKG